MRSLLRRPWFTFWLVLWLILQVQPCHAFSVRSTNKRGSSAPTLSTARNALMKSMPQDTGSPRPRREPTRMKLASSIQLQQPSPSNEEQYLQVHQKVSTRRSFRRLLEIGTVLSGRILRPLLCSLVRVRPRLLSATTNIDWDAFWSYSLPERQNSNGNTRGRPTSSTSLASSVPARQLSNAERVAEGLPVLGPTFVKLGQALATRPDLLHVPLAEALANLQDNISPFDNRTAKRIIRRDIEALVQRNSREKECNAQVDSTRTPPGRSHYKTKGYLSTHSERRAFLESLSEEPVAAASIAQVYKGLLPGYGPVAVKVQRPGIRRKVESDATLFHSVATWLENLKWPRGTPLHGQPVFGSTQFVRTVDEFTARVFEDLDFRREVKNMKRFKDLYGYQHHNHLASSKARGSSSVQVVVPEHIPELCSSRVIVMEWIEGTKLTDVRVGDENGDASLDERRKQQLVKENLAIVETAIECTLSQLMEDRILHGDPHAGNLLKVTTRDGQVKLGYLDFGVVSSVPQQFRDGIVCAVVQIVFGRNVDSIADLCVDLELLPREKLANPADRAKFVNDLRKVLDKMLVWPKDPKGRSTSVPKLRPFSDGLASISTLIARYEFTIPPYFLNNARALATLEGIGLKLDPDFNILRAIYPYAINQLMTNPHVSRKTEQTFLEICRSPDYQLVEINRVKALLNDWSILTGYPKRKILWDLVTSEGGRRVSRAVVKDFFRKRYRNARAWYLRRRYRRYV